MNTKKNINLKHIFLFILFLNFQNKTFTMFVDDSEIKTPLSIPREMLVQPIPRRTSSADFFSLSIFLSDDHNKFINFVLSQRTPENIILLKQFGGVLERIEELISTIQKR